MDSITGRKTHLLKYLPHNGKWQFLPVAKVNGRPKPELVIIDGKPRRGTTGTFYLQWRENGVRRTRPVGTSPREALDGMPGSCSPALATMCRSSAHIQLHTGDWPRTVDKRVELYEPEEISRFFAAWRCCKRAQLLELCWLSKPS